VDPELVRENVIEAGVVAEGGDGGDIVTQAEGAQAGLVFDEATRDQIIHQVRRRGSTAAVGHAEEGVPVLAALFDGCDSGCDGVFVEDIHDLEKTL
jgi:hypothetical protein